MHRVIVPPAVAVELAARPDEPGGRLPERPWLERKTPDPGYVRRVEQEPPAVDEGEKEAIALALELDTLVVLDDLPARRRAKRAGLEPTGALGILLRLYRLGLVEGDLASDLAALHEAGMYLSREVRDAVLLRAKGQ